MFSPQIYLQGLILGITLFTSIGAQNTHVLRTAVRGVHVLPTIALCILIDTVLILVGTNGLGALIESSPLFLALARYGGATFLVWYGLRCWKSALRGGTALDAGTEATTQKLKVAVVTVLAISLLNPHVYLDTVVLVGAVGSGLAAGDRHAFAAGAISASILWFSVLGLGARRWSTVLARPSVWRAIEALSGAMMLVLAALLLFGD